MSQSNASHNLMQKKKLPNLFMISLERSASIVFPVHYLTYFTWLRKKLYLSRLMFNNLTKLTRILYLDQKNSMQQVLFHLFRARAVLVSIKNFGQYKNLPWDKFVRKKITFCKIFHNMQNFLELQRLFDHLVDFLELLMFINAYIQYIIW